MALAMVLLVSALTGCRNDPDSNFEPPEFVFLPEIIEIPGDAFDIQNLTFANDLLYFSTVIYDVINEGTMEERWDVSTKLFTMNLDGTNVTELTNYDPGNGPFEDAEGSMHLMSLNIDSSGNIWVAEYGSFFRPSGDSSGEVTPERPTTRIDEPVDDTDDSDDANRTLPDDDSDDEETSETMISDDISTGDIDIWGPGMGEYLGDVVQIRKLDNTGAEILSLDASHLSDGADFFYVRALALDAEDNIYVATYSDLFVLNNDGSVQFKMDAGDMVESLMKMPDGGVAVFSWGETGRLLRMVDVSSRSWGANIDMPQNAWNLFPGGGDYSFIYQDSNSLFGIDAETGESIRLLNWIDTGVMINYLANLIILEDGRIVCTNQNWDQITGEASNELIILTKTPYADLPERIVLTLATVWMDWNLRNHIIEFNRTNQTYRIHVIDYSEFSTEDDWMAGLTRLSTEIIAGNVPDILDVANLPFSQYVARGLLEDLYPFIDNDPELNRTDFIESVFRAAEMDGGLYRVFPAFEISTLVGHPSVLGPNPGWNMDEFRAVLNANPQADMPMGWWMTKEQFLQSAVFLGMDEYVNWATGEVFFDRGGFAQLLEFTEMFQSDAQRDAAMNNDIWYDEQELIATGRQIMSNTWIWDFESTQRDRNTFGGEIVFKGFPTESGNGNSLNVGSGLAITTRCSDKDAAWEFMRILLTREWQNANIAYRFPTNKTSFDDFAARTMKESQERSEMGGIMEQYWENGVMRTVEFKPITQEDIDQIRTLIDSITRIASYDGALMDIIMEGAADYFSGRSSAQDAARIIQSRAAIYVSEQS